MVETEWTPERKDQLEWRLRVLVCAGELDITIAQQMMADDWTAAWMNS
jgi:hypothetical protein